LPPNLTLSGAGILSGTPQVSGTFGPFTVSATNGLAPAAIQTFSLTIRPPSCTRAITGTVSSVTANAGEYVRVVGASVGGDVTVNPNGSLVIYNAIVGGNTPSRFVVCGTKVGQGIAVQNATGWVLVGDAGNDDGASCAGNQVNLDSAAPIAESGAV
jgi:hypothetical protein